jgi:hypothetical protein
MSNEVGQKFEILMIRIPDYRFNEKQRFFLPEEDLGSLTRSSAGSHYPK